MPKQSIASQPRSARAQSTRDRMLSAAARAFAEKGLAGTKLKDDILAPAGIAPGSFYYQFDDKVDLLLAVLEEYSTQYRDRLRQVHRASPGRLLEDICRDSYALLFELAESSTDVLRIQLKERHSDEPRVGWRATQRTEATANRETPPSGVVVNR